MERVTAFIMQQTCFFCGNCVSYIHVHGHYQCPVCNTNALPCCDGDNCETNLTLMQAEQQIKVTGSATKPETDNTKP
jgi:hypothetical protein